MALLAVFTLVEKQATGRKFQRISGAILLVWAGALLVVSMKSGA
jgi:predicted metal-binding membrane protein